MIEGIRKFGLYTKGLVYFLIGLLTLLSSITTIGQVSGRNEVISFIRDQPFGHVLLFVLGIGLLGYTVWRYLSAFIDAKDQGNEKKAIIKRVAYFVSGTMYGLVSYSIIKTAYTASSGNSSKETAIAKLIALDDGNIILYAIAAILACAGIYQVHKGISKKFMDDIQYAAKDMDRISWSGTIGFCARGVAFFIFAVFVTYAAHQGNADQVKGMEGVFHFISSMSLGRLLVPVMATGLIAFGIFQYYLGRYSCYH